jgi:hypothetical protein
MSAVVAFCSTSLAPAVASSTCSSARSSGSISAFDSRSGGSFWRVSITSGRSRSSSAWGGRPGIQAGGLQYVRWGPCGVGVCGRGGCVGEALFVNAAFILTLTWLVCLRTFPLRGTVRQVASASGPSKSMAGWLSRVIALA